MGDFKKGHGDILRGNKCLLGLGGGINDVDWIGGTTTSEQISLEVWNEKHNYVSKNDEPPFVGRVWQGCKDHPVTLEFNEYYTPDGIAIISCPAGEFHKLQDVQTEFGLELNSTVSKLPDVITILEWAKSATRESSDMTSSK